MEARKEHKVKIVVFYCLLFSQMCVAFGKYVDECPDENDMIQLQDMIDNRYAMTCKGRCGNNSRSEGQSQRREKCVKGLWNNKLFL